MKNESVTTGEQLEVRETISHLQKEIVAVGISGTAAHGGAKETFFQEVTITSDCR